MEQSAILPYFTKFPSTIVFADERVKIFCVDLFSRVLLKNMFRVH